MRTTTGDLLLAKGLIARGADDVDVDHPPFSGGSLALLRALQDKSEGPTRGAAESG